MPSHCHKAKQVRINHREYEKKWGQQTQKHKKCYSTNITKFLGPTRPIILAWSLSTVFTITSPGHFFSICKWKFYIHSIAFTLSFVFPTSSFLTFVSSIFPRRPFALFQVCLMVNPALIITLTILRPHYILSCWKIGFVTLNLLSKSTISILEICGWPNTMHCLHKTADPLIDFPIFGIFSLPKSWVGGNERVTCFI